ncbi:MAG: dihydrofolate reductase family protein [Chloroflexota bacterium]
MRTLYAGLFVTADGVAEAPNTFVGPYFDAAVGAEVGAGMARTDTVLLGRRLYTDWAAYWPGKTAADDPYAAFINPVRKVVLSTTLESVTWEHSELVRTDHEAAVRRLKEEDGGDIAVNGSITVAQTMLRAGLLDELRLLVFPVIGGSGRRLFDGVGNVPLRLLESRALPTGVLSVTYGVGEG